MRMVANYKDCYHSVRLGHCRSTFQMIEITMRKRPREDSVLSQRTFFKKTAKGKVIKSEAGCDLTYKPLTICP
jgi:hypothetical protein